MVNTVYQKKICLLGNFAVGKTSLVRRFVYNLFEEKYISTIGVTISRKQVLIKQAMINMVIWDLAGNDEFNGKHTSYLQGAAGAILVCDLTRPDTFEIIDFYREKMNSISPGAKLSIIGNKLDAVTSLENLEPNLALLAKASNAPYFLTSAKAGTNVEEVFRTLANQLIENNK